jgi:hypothetical protein
MFFSTDSTTCNNFALRLLYYPMGIKTFIKYNIFIKMKTFHYFILMFGALFFFLGFIEFFLDVYNLGVLHFFPLKLDDMLIDGFFILIGLLMTANYHLNVISHKK